MKFYAVTMEVYSINVKYPGKNCNPAIGIYKSDEQAPIYEVNHYVEGQEEYAQFMCFYDGVYYARISQCDPDEPGCNALYGEKTEYQLTLTKPELEPLYSAMIYGKVTPPCVKTSITTTGMSEALTRSNGTYFMPHIPGDFTLTATAIKGGYKTHEQDFSVEPNKDKEIDVSLASVFDLTDV